MQSARSLVQRGISLISPENDAYKHSIVQEPMLVNLFLCLENCVAYWPASAPYLLQLVVNLCVVGFFGFFFQIKFSYLLFHCWSGQKPYFHAEVFYLQRSINFILCHQDTLQPRILWYREGIIKFLIFQLSKAKHRGILWATEEHQHYYYQS